MTAESELHRRRTAYEDFKHRAVKAGQAADSLYWAFAAADMAYRYHLGRWADPDLERLLDELGPAVSPRRPASGRATGAGGRRVVHVVSGASGGGHIAVVDAWVSALARRGGYVQSVLSSEVAVYHAAGPRSLEGAGEGAAGLRAAPAGLAPDARARWLIEELARVDPEAVVLHIDPADVVAVCAVTQYRRLSGARVCFYNHADHLFSVGPALADSVVHYRVASARYSVAHRGVEPARIQFVPLTAPPEPAPEGLVWTRPPGATASVTVANYYKLVPDGHWNLAEVLRRLLSREPRHHHLMVADGGRLTGLRVARAFRRLPRPARSRVVWLGRRTDLDNVLASADFAIDSCPIPGAVVRVHAMRAGRPLVAVQHPRWPLISDTDPMAPDYPLRAASNEEMADAASRLIHEPDWRREVGESLARRYREHFSEAALADAVERVLDARPDPESPEIPSGAPAFDPDYLVTRFGRMPEPGALARQAQARLGYPRGGLGRRARTQLDRGLSGARQLAALRG